MALISRMPELGDIIAISAFWKLKPPPLCFFQEQILKAAAQMLERGSSDVGKRAEHMGKVLVVLPRLHKGLLGG